MLTRILETNGFNLKEVHNLFRVMNKAPNIFCNFIKDRIKSEEEEIKNR